MDQFLKGLKVGIICRYSDIFPEFGTSGNTRGVPMKTGTMSDLDNHGTYDNSDGTIGKFKQNWYNEVPILI